MKNIVIFASGRGSNAQKIIEHFRAKDNVSVSAIVTNRKDAGVLELALRNNIPSRVLNKSVFFKTNSIVEYLKEINTDLVILAGFLWLIPKHLIEAFPNQILNIHPSLLPKHGGKGMYGHFVHEAVKKAGDKKSGITIHFVNEHFDEGKHVFQKSVALEDSMNPKDIASAVLALEHEYYSMVIEDVLFPTNVI